MVRVRGIGVAVITSRSQPPPRSTSVRRCATPKRCCSSTTARPRLRNRAPSWISEWVPTTNWAQPLATALRVSRRSAAPSPAVSRATRIPCDSRSPWMVEKCCSASTSVGAISAACAPCAITTSAATTATMVFPEPTSPWSSRRIISGDSNSFAIVASASDCEPVRRNGRTRRTRSRTSSSTVKVWSPGRPVRSCRRRNWRPSAKRKNSSKMSRRWPAERRWPSDSSEAPGGGKWTSSRAFFREGSSRRAPSSPGRCPGPTAFADPISRWRIPRKRRGPSGPTRS